MAQLIIAPMTGGTNKRVNVSADSSFKNVISQYLYLNYRVDGTSGEKSIVTMGAYLESRVKIFGEETYTPPEMVTTRFGKDSWLMLNIADAGSHYMFKFSEETDVTGYLVDYNIEPGIGTNGSYGPGFIGGYNETDYFNHCCYATYRYWLGNSMELALSSTETTKIFVDWNYTGWLSSITPIRDSDNVYLSFNNLPYIDYYPTEINDNQTAFLIRYSVPDPSQLDFIQFGLLNNSGSLLAGYQLASNDGTSYYFTLTPDDLESIWLEFNTVRTANIKLGVRSKNLDGDTILVTYPMLLEIVDAPPSLGFTVTDADAAAVAATGNASTIVRYQSDIQITVNPQGYKKAYVVDYYIGQGNNRVYNSTTARFSNVQSNVFTIYAKDSRGVVTLQNITLSMVDYFPLTCNLAADTPTTDDKLKITLSGKYWSGNFGAKNNHLSFEYKYTSNVEGNSRDWTAASPSISISQGNYYTSFDVDVPNHVDTYTVQVRASDEFNTVLSNSVTVKAYPVFDWSQNDFNFNVPVSIQGDLTVNGKINNIEDHVVSQGTSGIWTYRLWDSGVAECWGTVAPAAHSITSAWGSIYTKDNAIAQQSYPFQFTVDPVVSMTLHNPTGNCWAFTGTPGGVSKSPAFGLARGTSGSVTVGARIMAIGRWK